METYREYRLKPVTRYIVTRHEWRADAENESCGTNRQIGPEYANEDIAFEVAYALARHEHERLGYGMGDERIRYPRRPSEENCTLVVADGVLHKVASG